MPVYNLWIDMGLYLFVHFLRPKVRSWRLPHIFDFYFFVYNSQPRQSNTSQLPHINKQYHHPLPHLLSRCLHFTGITQSLTNEMTSKQQLLNTRSAITQLVSTTARQPPISTAWTSQHFFFIIPTEKGASIID